MVPNINTQSKSSTSNIIASDILNKTVTDPQTVQSITKQPSIVYDSNNPAVTVTETKTITGPPEYVLSNNQQINDPMPLKGINEDKEDKEGKEEKETETSEIPEQSKSIMDAESKVIRKIKEIDDSNKDTTPLLATVEQDSTDKDDEDDGQTKKVNTI